MDGEQPTPQPEPPPEAPTSTPAETPTPSAAAGGGISKGVLIVIGIGIVVIVVAGVIFFNVRGQKGAITEEQLEEVIEGVSGEEVELPEPGVGVVKLSTLTCGEALSSSFLDSLFGGTLLYDESGNFPCTFAVRNGEFIAGTFVIWEGNQYNGLLSGAEALPEADTSLTSGNIGESSFEYDGPYLGHTVELGFITLDGSNTVLITLTKGQISLDQARAIAQELDRKL